MRITLSGAGWAALQPPTSDVSIQSMYGVADTSEALDANIYVAPLPIPSNISVAPPGATLIAHLKCAEASQTPLVEFPLGLQIGEAYILVQFNDTGATHEVYVYTK